MKNFYQNWQKLKKDYTPKAFQRDTLKNMAVKINNDIMKCQKELFSLREDEHYLNCAYKAPLLKLSEEACKEALVRERNPIDISANDFFEDIHLIRKYFAQIINADTSQIAITPSASYSFSSILKNTKAKPNGNAINVKDEFPSGYFALEKWCNQNANELITIGPTANEAVGKSWNENILKSINEQTSIVLLSSVHWMNGLKFDLQEIGNKCRQFGAKFIVDGTQSVGALKMDIKKYKIDALVCSAYKWLLGPYSTALSYFSEDYNNGEPLEEAWINRKNSNQFSQLANYEKEYRTGANRYNVGETSNFILIPILRESLKQIIGWNPNNIQQYSAELIKPLITYLKSLDVELEEDAFFSNHIFAIPVAPNINLKLLNENLIKNKVYLSQRGNSLRVSVNVFNDKRDIEVLINSIQESLRFNSK